MFSTFNLSFGILATVLATFPYIGRIFVQFSGHSASLIVICLYNFKQEVKMGLCGDYLVWGRGWTQFILICKSSALFFPQGVPPFHAIPLTESASNIVSGLMFQLKGAALTSITIRGRFCKTFLRFQLCFGAISQRVCQRTRFSTASKIRIGQKCPKR